VYGLRAFHFKKYFRQASKGGPVVVGGPGGVWALHDLAMTLNMNPISMPSAPMLCYHSPGHPADVAWSEVHIDDLVDGYVRIVEADTAAVKGVLFHFADESANTNLQIATAYARAAGYVLCHDRVFIQSIPGAMLLVACRFTSSAS
jgi:nucleoside-diphosphate-sugar epimerase